MPRLPKALTTLTAAGLIVFPALVFSAQPPAPTSAGTEKSQDKEKAKETAKAPTDPIERIKDEGLNRSKVMETLNQLTDVIGPRLTGSPGLKRANEWTRDQLTKWGLENARLEAWGPFGRGWTLKRFSAQVTEPLCVPLIGYPKAWCSGTDGTVVGPVVYLDATKDSDYDKYKGKLKGAIVLLSSISEVPPGLRLSRCARPTRSSSTSPTPPSPPRAGSVAVDRADPAVRPPRAPWARPRPRARPAARRATPSAHV
ncbi:MAG: hypothetical protein U0794_00860 [Isosphaeraceae bacterium]